MILIRQAEYKDFPAIAKLHSDNWKLHYHGILSDYYLDHEVEKDRYNIWHQRLLSPSINQQIFVAILQNNIVGFCCLYLDHDPLFGSLIDNLHVSLENMNSGIGKKLLQESANYIGNNSKNAKMYLWAYESNLHARFVYEKLGGQHLETLENRNQEGQILRSCRIIWNESTKIMSNGRSNTP